MIVLETHVVVDIPSKVRFVDYTIGLFSSYPTRNAIKKAIKKKYFFVNNSVPQTGTWLTNGDVIELRDSMSSIPKAYPLQIEILYEDNWFAIVNKPGGIIVSGNQFRTLENALIGQMKPSVESDRLKWGRAAHRLDASTSGCIIIAKTQHALRLLKQMFEDRLIKKEYCAVLSGRLDQKKNIDTQLEGKEAITRIEPIKTVESLRDGNLSMVKLKIDTGRKHQIRIHCASEGLPIVGDTIYGIKGKTLLHKGLFLAATKVSFVHPITNETIEIEIEIPTKFERLLSRTKANWEKYQNSNE